MHLLFVLAFAALFELHTISAQSSNICDFPKVTGPCKARFERYFFDVKKGRCLKFYYGGCNGNENNFNTRADCEQTCQKRVCTLPFEPIPCQTNRQWYYDSEKQKCNKLDKGKCNDNRNRFSSQKKCEQLCSGVKTYPCGPLPPCARPPPETCPGDNFIYYFINGVKCISGCTYPTCPNSQCCEKSTECGTNQFCSSRCCRDSSIEPKPGACPPSNKLNRYKKSDCTSDSQCPDKRKCCPFGTRFYCVDPE